MVAFLPTVNGTQAYTTSSVNIGTNDTPTQTLNVKGVTELSGGLVHKRIPKTSNYTVTTSDYFIAADSSGGVITFSLPNASSATEGQTWVFKDEGGAAPHKQYYYFSIRRRANN